MKLGLKVTDPTEMDLGILRRSIGVELQQWRGSFETGNNSSITNTNISVSVAIRAPLQPDHFPPHGAHFSFPCDSQIVEFIELIHEKTNWGLGGGSTFMIFSLMIIQVNACLMLIDLDLALLL